MPEGEVGTLCVTPLWTNHATPFLRWNSGDVVRYIDKTDKGRGIWAELFPMIRHANRTTGFFKLRGVNMNHADFEDTMFSEPQVNDFQAVLVTEEKTGREGLRLLIEVKRGSDNATVRDLVGALIKRTFEVTPDVEVLPLGTLAAEFERSIKAPQVCGQANLARAAKRIRVPAPRSASRQTAPQNRARICSYA